VLPWCREHDVALVAYTPFGTSPAIYAGETAQGRTLQQVAAAHGATPRQAALAFLLRNPDVFVIPKASSMAHVTDNAGATALTLSDAELAQLDAAFPRGKPRRDLPMI
jgi:diketogulonate reductase-like aldo/keto reductase